MQVLAVLLVGLFVVLWVVYRVVYRVVDKVEGLGNERTSTRVLPSAKRSFFNGILTSVPIPTIHTTAYLIPVFLTI